MPRSTNTLPPSHDVLPRTDTQLLGRQLLDAIGIDDDVEGGTGNSHENGRLRRGHDALVWVHQRQIGNGGHDQHTTEQQP
jgi:hypothetical protein